MARPLALLVAASVITFAGCVRTATDRNYREDPTASYVRAELADIASAPHQYRNSDVLFTAIFNGNEEGIFVPAYTPFTEEMHHAFSVWVHGTRIWDRDASLAGMVRTIFIRKDNPNISKVVSARRFQPVLIKGKIKSHFDNTPWIEAYDLVQRGSPIYTTTGLSALLMGIDAAKAKDIKSAQAFLDVASSKLRTNEAQLEINLVLARALLRTKGKYEVREAVDRYSKALKLSDGNMRIKGELQIAEMISEMLDRGEPVGEIPGLPEPTGETAPGGISQKQHMAITQGLLAQIQAKDAEIERLKAAASDDTTTREAIKRYEEQVTQLEKALDDARMEAEQNAAAVEAAKMEAEDLHNTVDQLKIEMAGSSEARAALQAQLDAELQKIQDLNDQIAELSAGQNEREAALNKKIEQLTQVKAEIEEQITLYEDKVLQANETIEDQKQTIDSLKAALAEGGDQQERIAQLQTDLDAANAKASNLETARQEDQNKLAQLEQTNSDLQTQIDELKAAGDPETEAKLVEAQQKIVELEESKADLLDQIDALKAASDPDTAAKLAEAQAKCAELEQSNTDLLAQIEQLKAAGDPDMAARLQEAQDKVALLEQVNTELNDEIEKLRTAGGNEELQARLAACEAKVTELRETNAALQDEVDRLKEGGDPDLAQKLQDSLDAIAQLEQDKATLQAEVDKLKAAGGGDTEEIRREIAKEYEEEIETLNELISRLRDTISKQAQRIEELENR
jgi:chromosome segregation ATPase